MSARTDAPNRAAASALWQQIGLAGVRAHRIREVVRAAHDVLQSTTPADANRAFLLIGCALNAVVDLASRLEAATLDARTFAKSDDDAVVQPLAQAEVRALWVREVAQAAEDTLQSTAREDVERAFVLTGCALSVADDLRSLIDTAMHASRHGEQPPKVCSPVVAAEGVTR